MNEATWYRADALSGIVAIVFFVTSFAVQGQTPAPASSTSTLVAYAHSHRTATLTACLLLTLGSTIYIWFLSTLRTALAEVEGSRGTLATLVFGSGLVAIAFAVAGYGSYAAISFKLASDPGMGPIIRGLYDLGNSLQFLGNVIFSAATAATAVTILKTDMLPRWIAWLSIACALLDLLSGLGIAAISGPFAAGGALFLLCFVTYSVWTIALAVSPARHPMERAAIRAVLHAQVPGSI